MPPAPFSLEPYLAAIRDEIELALERATRFEPGCPLRLAEAVRYSLLAPGKRLRPVLTVLAAEACGGSRAAALPAAVAVEMIHAYSLVHDDLPAMDDDDLRRGRPTNHKVYGEALAILVGDALLTRAFEVLAAGIPEPAIAQWAVVALARAAGASALVGGQADDLAAETAEEPANPAAALAQLEAIHHRKTGAMFNVALELGGLVAGASTERLAQLACYGQNLGLAFQIGDDLLDVRGSEAILGKRVAKDAARGKRTYPGLLGVSESERQARASVEAACAAVSGWGPAAEPLVALARYVVERDR